MRPRVFPAEDLCLLPTVRPLTYFRFNEAAGIPRGRHEIGNKGGKEVLALQ